MAFTESTPVTIHTHSTAPGASSTVSYDAGTPPYDSINSLGSDQFGDAVLGTAVLSGGNEVVISASIANNLNYNGFSTYPGFPQVSETIIDNGVATTQTLALTNGSDFLNAPDGEVLLKVVPPDRRGFCCRRGVAHLTQSQSLLRIVQQFRDPSLGRDGEPIRQRIGIERQFQSDPDIQQWIRRRVERRQRSDRTFRDVQCFRIHRDRFG